MFRDDEFMFVGKSHIVFISSFLARVMENVNMSEGRAYLMKEKRSVLSHENEEVYF